MCHVGFGTWCEGLRLHADNSGTSRLLGLPCRDTALIQLAVPVAAGAMTSIAVGIGPTLLGLVTPAALAWTLVWSLSIGGLLAGTHLMAALRGLPPIGVFGPRAGMPAMVFWYVKPLLSMLVVGTATAAWVTRTASPWVAFSCMIIATAGLVAWGLSLVDKRDRRD